MVAGHDPKDPFSTRTPIPDYSAALNKDIHGLALGVPDRVFGPGPVEAETMAAFENAVGALEQLGAKTRRLDIPALEYVDLAMPCIQSSEAYAYHEATIQTRPNDYGEDVRQGIHRELSTPPPTISRPSGCGLSLSRSWTRS